MRRILWKWHSIAGLIVAVPLFLVALTGSLLVFKSELNSVFYPELVHASTDTRLPIDTLIEKAEAKLPEYELLGWGVGEAGNSDVYYVSKIGEYEWQKGFVDPATGDVLGYPMSFTTMFTDWMLSLHYSLLLDHIGLLIGAIISILLIFMGVSGLILHRRFWKTLFTLRFKKGIRLFLSDAHKMLGVIGIPIYLILGFSGAWWNIEHIIDEGLIEHHDDTKYTITKTYYNKDIDLDVLIAKAKEELPNFVTTFIRLPDPSYSGIHLFGHRSDNGVLRSKGGSIVSFNEETGEYTGKLDVQTAPKLYQFVDAMRPLHYGYFGGIVTKVIWCIVGFFPCVLAISGFWMWFKRRKPKKA